MGPNGNRAVRTDATEVGGAVGQTQAQPTAQRDTRAERLTNPSTISRAKAEGARGSVGLRYSCARVRLSTITHTKLRPAGSIGFGIKQRIKSERDSRHSPLPRSR